MIPKHTQVLNMNRDDYAITIANGTFYIEFVCTADYNKQYKTKALSPLTSLCQQAGLGSPSGCIVNRDGRTLLEKHASASWMLGHPHRGCPHTAGCT